MILFKLLNLRWQWILTFGAGGHSKLLLQHNIKLIALDRDQSVQPYADKLREKYKNFQFFIDTFDNFDQYITNYDFLIADLGLSSMQLSDNRGFSFMTDSPLDMNMSLNQRPLYEILKNLSTMEIYAIIKTYGEEKRAAKITDNIVKYMLRTPITSTLHLKEAIGFYDIKIIARVFQAFRIFLNEELILLEKLLHKINQNCIFIAFHSLEVKLIQKILNNKFLQKKKYTISVEEKEANNRSRSAILLHYNNYQFN